MQTELTARIDQAVTRIASTTFALATGFAVYRWFLPSLAQPMIGAYAAAAGAVAFLLADRMQAKFGTKRKYPASVPFQVLEYAPEPLPELLLSEPYAPASAAADPLVLDDILAELGPDSRVVRLFDRDAMPTPAQLKSRIDAHLGRSAAHAPVPDASQALHDALAELRRSIG